MILLDTHTWLWLLHDPTQLTTSTPHRQMV